MKHAKCTIITPLDADGRRVRETIERALSEANFLIFNIEKIQPGAVFTNFIMDSIQSSDFIIVDISRQNPNVFYELGYAHALRKPTILLLSSDETSSIPSDLQGNLYIIYDKANLSSLRDKIISSAMHIIKR